MRKLRQQLSATAAVIPGGTRLAALLLICVFSLPVFAQESVRLADGSELMVFLQRPDDAGNEPAPLLILMGGGPGNLSISRDTSRWLGSGFASRGWVVAVPVSPNNRSFRGPAGNALIPQLVNALQTRSYISVGKTLLAGISNGGLSALEIARRDPGAYLGVVAVPAVSSSTFENKALAGFPVYLRIGGEDELGWANRYEETVEVMTEAGVDLDAAILEGASHMFRMDWESLDSWLERALDKQ